VFEVSLQVEQVEGINKMEVQHMAKITEITIPVFRILANVWRDEFYVQQRQGNGRWKTVSKEYAGLHSAKAKIGDLVLKAIAEAEAEE